MRSAFCFVPIALLLFYSCVPSFINAWQHIGPAPKPSPVNITWIQKLNTLVSDMETRWSILDSICDPNAAFALLYLYMTIGGRDAVTNHYFEDGDKVSELILTFANRYSVAINKWMAGQRTIDEELTKPWFQAFHYASSNYSSVTENILQQINVHINYDLALAVEEMKFPKQLDKDYQRINDLLADGMSTAFNDLTQRYDPYFNFTETIPILNQLLLDAVFSFRHHAWTNGQHLIHSWTSIGRKLIHLMLYSQTTFFNTLLETYNFGRGTTTAHRVAYCQSHHSPSPLQILKLTLK